MRASKLEQMFQENFNRGANFKHIADYIVAHHTKGLDDERKKDVSADTALGMAMGEALTKNKYLSIGIAVGALGTGLAVKLYYDFKDRNDTEEEEEV